MTIPWMMVALATMACGARYSTVTGGTVTITSTFVTGDNSTMQVGDGNDVVGVDDGRGM